MTAPLTTWFGPYRLTARIGTGGMAEIYLARRRHGDGTLGPSVAVKRLLPHLVSQSPIVQMFLNEAKITAQIDHPNVIHILDLGHEQGEPFISMELLDGRTFAELRQTAAAQGRRVPLGITLRILAEACRGLDAAHKARDQDGRLLCIVHRDFSPDNVHVGFDGAIKVIDFGIAKAENVNSGTEPGTLKGKFFYMSPEMISGAAVDHRADLFAAGVMLYEQLCGRRPFTGMTTEEVLHRIGEGRPKRPSEFDPSVPPVLEAICLTALSHHPDGRFPSLNEFVRSLESVGGVAQLATQADVASYVDSLYPLQTDKRRQALAQARTQDPSSPGDAAKGAAATASAESATAASVADAAVARASDDSGGEAPKGEAHDAPARVERRSLPLLPGWTRWAGIAALALAVGVIGLRPWRLLKSGPQSTEELVSHAEAQLLAKDYEGATRTARMLAEQKPRDVRAPLLEARAAIGLRSGKRADAALERAVALTPKNPEPYALRAELRQLQGNLPEALAALDQAQARAPRNRVLAKRRAVLLSKAGQLEPAAESLSQLLSHGFDAELAIELGSVKLRQSRPREAVVILGRVLKDNPKQAEAHYYLGTALAMLGAVDGSLKAYTEAVALAPEDMRALVGLCELQTKAGQKEEATKTRATIAQRFPDVVRTLGEKCPP